MKLESDSKNLYNYGPSSQPLDCEKCGLTITPQRYLHMPKLCDIQHVTCKPLDKAVHCNTVLVVLCLSVKIVLFL